MNLSFITVPALIFLALALALSFYRLLQGPRLPDRVVALDLIATIFVGMIAVYAIATQNDVFLDIALVVALLNFVATVAFGFFVEHYR